LSNDIDRKWWLWIEPYVHVSIIGNKALLYNTLSGSKLEYTDEPDILHILKKMLRPENLLVIPITRKELNHPRISCFVQEIKTRFMGDMEDVVLSYGKPIQLKSIINLQADIKQKRRDHNLEGKAILSYLREVSIYINNSSHSHSSVYEPLPPLLYKQVLFPYFERRGTPQELSLDTIKMLCNSLENSGLASINIIGGNILDHSRFEDMVVFFDNTSRVKAYHLHYLDALNNLEKLGLIKDNEGKSWINLLVTFPIQDQNLETAVRFAGEQGNVKLTFLISGMDELNYCDSIPGRFGLRDFLLKPYYNGSNMDFFKDAVFIHPEDITAARPSQREIVARMVVNSNFFGKLTIMSNGDVYSNLNTPKLGNIHNHIIHDLIFKELYHGRNWLRVRPNLSPCKGCLYNVICEEISNYEFVLRRNDLCTVLNYNGK